MVAVIQEYDRCIKCRGCVVACQRNFIWSTPTNKALKASGTAERVSSDEVTVIKPEFGFDFPPFLKYNCWHCPNPPCATRCPFAAIRKMSDGSVWIDHTLCKPGVGNCKYQCVTDCGRGGYPKVGVGDGVNLKAYKCDLCYNRRLPLLTLGPDGKVKGNRSLIQVKTVGSFQSGALAAIDTTNTSAIETYRVPACVLACPTAALRFGDLDAIGKRQEQYRYQHGDGNWRWAGNTVSPPPTSDPLYDDHVAPLTHLMVDGKLVAMGAFLAGLYALYKRRREVEGAGGR